MMACCCCSFRSTLPHGERHSGSARSISVRTFRSTLPHGERLAIGAGWRAKDRFRSTLPHGKRPSTTLTPRPSSMFRSTLPHGERPSRWPPLACWTRFRSTLPHGERRAGSSGSSEARPFRSTLPHGKRRGETPMPDLPLNVSIHAPAWEATCASATGVCSAEQFRSTLPHGERLSLINSLKQRLKLTAFCEHVVQKVQYLTVPRLFARKFRKTRAANPTGEERALPVRRSYDEKTVHIRRRLRTNVFDAPAPLFAQHVKPQ